MCRTSLCACTLRSNGSRRSSSNTALAPESASWWRNSLAVYCGLVFTSTTPAFSAPKVAMGYCRELGSISARRSPGCRPAWWRR